LTSTTRKRKLKDVLLTFDIFYRGFGFRPLFLHFLFFIMSSQEKKQNFVGGGYFQRKQVVTIDLSKIDDSMILHHTNGGKYCKLIISERSEPSKYGETVHVEQIDNNKA
jgi:hypothetical protein